MEIPNGSAKGNGSNLKTENNWWTRRTSLEKKLFISTLILFVISITMTTILAIIHFENSITEINNNNRKRSIFNANVVDLNVLSEDNRINKYLHKTQQFSEVCLTPTCIETAHLFLSTIDESVSPCNDFYRFTCGKWLNNSIIPDNRLSISTTGGIVETMELQFKAQLAYLGDDPLIEILIELGGWPVAEGFLWNETNFDWVDNNVKMREMGLPFNQFYHLSVGLDIKNTTKHIINIGEVLPGVGSRRVMLNGINDPEVRSYYDLLLESAALLGGKQFNPNLFKDLIQLIDFQILVVNWTTPQEETRDINKLYNKMTVQDLQLIAPNTPWIRLLSGIFKQNIEKTDEVIVNNPNYVKQIDSMLKYTEKRILANHMIADVILTSMPYLSPKWLRLHDLYLHRLTGLKSVPPRWQICIKSASSLSTAFSALYVRKYFDKKSKHKVEEIVNFIHQEFIQMLERVDWMDQKTRIKALEKARTITSYIGFPEQLLNDKEIAKIYQNLEEYSDKHFFQNMLKLSKWIIDYSTKNLRQLRIKGNWQNFADAAVVNAYYNAIENAIIFPAGILQGNFFNYHNPDYLNFGGIGTVIAHEITHAFDDIGKQFDKYGNNKNWWDIETDRRFKSKAQCLIDQYNNYFIPENAIKLNGINTLGENIADNIGVRESFRAFKAYAKHNQKQQLLPGLKYTPEQLFWITFGNIWCTKVRPQMYKMIIDTETHSPSRFRVIGSVSNLEEFAQSFNCPKGSPMNPIKKCKIW